MSKKYFNYALVYAVLAMIMGAFYREFTKYVGFTGQTTLSIVHTHYFAMGMIFFLLLTLFQNSYKFSKGKHINKAIIGYNIGLNITAVIFIVRGILTALEQPISKGLNASLSGISGISHIMLAICLPYILYTIKKSIKN